MAFDLSHLTATPDLRTVQPIQARLVCGMRYNHVSRRVNDYSHRGLARYLGSHYAIQSFHVFMDEVGRAWPEPITLNSPCQPAFSYDEMLLTMLCTAAARDDRTKFDELIRDMVGNGQRRAIWAASRRLMRYLVSVAN